jgi:ketosteroid isomerase-like protein
MSETADLFRAGLERFGDGDLDGYLELLSDEVEVEFPFAPPGRPERLRGRENLRRYLEPLLARVAYDSITSLVVYETDVAGTIVAEMTASLRLLESDRTYSRRYVAVVRAADGRVVSYREYWNPLALSDRAGAAEAS